jgi:hypothetical protein
MALTNTCIEIQVNKYKNMGATVLVSDVDKFRTFCVNHSSNEEIEELATLTFDIHTQIGNSRNPSESNESGGSSGPASGLDKKKLDALINKNVPGSPAPKQ